MTNKRQNVELLVHSVEQSEYTSIQSFSLSTCAREEIMMIKLENGSSVGNVQTKYVQVKDELLSKHRWDDLTAAASKLYFESANP